MKRLYIFDFDETLVHNHGQVRLIKPDGTVQVLTQHEYYEYRPGPGEKIDLSDYDEVTDPVLNKEHLDLLQKLSDNAVILTARTYGDPVVKFLKSLGIEVPVYAVGINDPNIDCILPNANRKKAWIKNAILQSNYDYIEFWDDNHFNIEATNELKKEFPHVEIITHLVN